MQLRTTLKCCAQRAEIFRCYQKNAIFTVYFALLACTTNDRVVEAIHDARQKNLSIPLAHHVDETLTIEGAYRVQRQLVRRELATRSPVGFKAGLTSSDARARFASREPIAGVLIHDALPSGSSLQLGHYPGLYLEVEVAMRIGTSIRRKLDTTDELKVHVDGIAPAIELPNLHYTNQKELNALDVIASNVAAAHFIVGVFTSPDARDANRLQATLTCEGKVLNEAQGRDSMGDQWTAALWLANKLIDQGWTLEPGQILLTGALGSMVKASQGICQANFRDWGVLNVRIE